MLRVLIVIALLGAGAAWYLTRPVGLAPDALSGLTPDPEAGARVFAAAGCASCHMSPDGEDKLVLAGGQRFESDFGTFIAPNISPHPTAGIGGWSDLEIANAVMRGISPSGGHYYPAFPYAAYANASLQDITDLIGYLRTLPADATASAAHDVGFPFNIRRAVGGWKRLFAPTGWEITDGLSPEAERGRYLSEALGHCAECHTPRNALGGLRRDAWMAGAANPSGEGRVPNITPAVLDWSEREITQYLTTGFTPSFDTSGGEMVDVIENLALLPDSDRAAIAAYLKALPPVQTAPDEG